MFSPRGARALVLRDDEVSFAAGAVVRCVTGRWRWRLPSTRARTSPSKRLSTPFRRSSSSLKALWSLSCSSTSRMRPLMLRRYPTPRVWPSRSPDNGSAPDRSDDHDALTDGAQRANIDTVQLPPCQVRLTPNLGPRCRAAAGEPTARVAARWTAAARATPNDLVGSTPPVGETAVHRLDAQAAGNAACHERIKAPPETINLDYVAGHASDRRGRRSSFRSGPAAGGSRSADLVAARATERQRR